MWGVRLKMAVNCEHAGQSSRSKSAKYNREQMQQDEGCEMLNLEY
jgi:hypothetical protein